MLEDKEEVYDEEIAPLINKIIAICKEHEIPWLATFEYAPGMLCTTVNPRKGQTGELGAATEIILRGFTTFTVGRNN